MPEPGLARLRVRAPGLVPIQRGITLCYCPYCDLLIAHQDELEAYLAAYFAEHQPDVIGNDYLVVGTFERPDWEKGVNAPVPVAEMLDYLHDFRQVLNFEVTGGWMPGEEVGERGARHKA